MRLNQYIARASGLSRRAADKAISEGRVFVNGQLAAVGQSVQAADKVTLDDRATVPNVKTTTILLNKPVGYICSRDGQGGKTVYDLLPKQFYQLKLVGRLDKDSSGLILLTNDGQLANQLTHPRYEKTKIYEVELDKPLAPLHGQMIVDHGITLSDGPSKFMIEKIKDQDNMLVVTLREGRNRQIRRTFEALGYHVTKLHRTHFGHYRLDNLKLGDYTLN